MRSSIVLLLILGFVAQIFSQQSIDRTLSFQTDPAKKFSIYVPSGYDANIPNALMIGFHPFNTNRWNAQAWRDTLIVFAERNQLIMLCPDGGRDGKVDDAIDTAFTTFLIDSALTWYNINPQKIFAMGFSWGGRATYSYGMAHVDRFAGFMPIGAAITGTQQVAGILDQSKDKPYFIIHGSRDIPNTRFIPIRDAIIAEGACVETRLLNNVGHTIDFPNRNQLLDEGFRWIDSVKCGISTATIPVEKAPSFQLFPNPTQSKSTIYITDSQLITKREIELFDLKGRLLSQFSISQNKINLPSLAPGLYFLKINNQLLKLEILK